MKELFYFKLHIVDPISHPIKIYLHNFSMVFSSRVITGLVTRRVEIIYLVVRDKIKKWQTIIKHINI